MNAKPLLFLTAILLDSLLTAQAVAFDQETKINADDAVSFGMFDAFGWSVSISGDTAIVGAWGFEDAVNNSGSAYLFDVSTGNQIAKLAADDAALEDYFGISVAISGDTAIVGAYRDDDAGSNSGSAYLFDITTGKQIVKLTAEDAAAGDNFGISVAISGGTAIVGAIRDEDAGRASGSAYLFDVSTGNQIAKLTADDAAREDYFGNSVAISGDTAIVGAWADDDAGRTSGSAYLFDVSTGNQIAKLTADDAFGGDRFGNSVAISGDTAIVGAWADDDSGPSSGSAYLFDVNSGNQISKLTAIDAASGDEFGSSVSISGDTAIVGAYREDYANIDSGSAYLFDVVTGNQIAKLNPRDANIASINAEFGRSVSISGDTAIVGAWGLYGAGSGLAYLFRNTVPEPSTFVLTAIACLETLSRRRKW